MNTPRTLFSQFHEFCRRRNLIPPGSSVIAAVSGGIDSAVLLDLLAEERAVSGLRLVVAHFNHRLRGDESDGDEQFVAGLAARYGCEFYVERADTAERAKQQKVGIQAAARDLRYAFFERLRESLSFDTIATAHNADDNAETILLHLFRGTGFRGLSGIPYLRKEIVRPLLFASRAEIEAYATMREVKFRVDSSNATDHYARNYIRHHIVPRVKSNINPSVVEALTWSSELFRDLDGYLRDTARGLMDRLARRNAAGEIEIAIDDLEALPVLLRQYVLMGAYQRATGSDPDQASVLALQGLCSSGTGSWATLREGWHAHRDRRTIVLRRELDGAEFMLAVELGRRYDLGPFHFHSEVMEQADDRERKPGSIEYVDVDRLGGESLILRSWREGDWFMPLGLGGRKKVSDYLIDARVPRHQKRNVPVLTTAEGEIVWLCGKRLDDRFKLTEQTRRMGKLAFELRDIERTDAAIDQGQW